MKNNSMWVYPWDLADEGIPNVLDRIKNAGIDGVNVTAYYHSGRFFLPHNPKRKVHFAEPGALYFEPDQSWYGNSKIKPPISKFASNSFWSELREETEKRSMTLTVWMLALHNSHVGFEYPETSVVNAFGDKSSVALCPSNPDVQELITSIVADIANNLQADKILIESLEYMPLRHDYHHEVIGIPLTPTIEFLMSLSFNESLVKDAKEQGIDIEAIRSFVRNTCEEQFRDPSKPINLTWDELMDSVNGELSKYLTLRESYLNTFIRKIHNIVKGSGREIKLASVDFGPILPLGPNELSWENGVNIKEWNKYLDELHPTFYFTDSDVFTQKVKEYIYLKEKLGQNIDIIPAVRAILPQTTSKEDLEKTIKLLKDLSDGHSFYNYGFMSYQTLDWIGEILKNNEM